MDLNKEIELYDAFLQCLIDKMKAGTAEIKDFALVKDFLRENNIGANPKTHKATAELAKMPFPEHDEDEPQTKLKAVK